MLILYSHRYCGHFECIINKNELKMGGTAYIRNTICYAYDILYITVETNRFESAVILE